MSVQASPQHMQTTIPPDAYAIDAPSSRRQYSQQSPQAADPYRTTSTPQSSRRPSRRSSGNATQSSNLSTPPYRSPAGSNPSSSTPRANAMSPTTRASPMASIALSSSPYQPSRRDQRNDQEQLGGPPIPPPPRTSSNQKFQSANLPSNAPLADRTATSRQAGRLPDDQTNPSRATDTFKKREQESQDRTHLGDYGRENERDRSRDDTATAAAAAARSRRRGPTSPEGPQRSASTREARAQRSPAATESRSAANVSRPTPPAKLAREGSEVINRVVVTDPSVDLEREKARLAEAIPAGSNADVTPVTGLGLVSSEGVEDGGRGAGRSRQDYASNAARRKETKFGEYVLGQTLGEGEFGKVKLGWKKDGSVQVAIKLIRRESLGTNPSRLPKIYREITILRELSHPNIVRLHEMVETDRHIGIILEYASGGELFDYILNHRYLKDNAARRLFAQLISGVGYLHKKGIVHRDLKLENLLLDRNRNIIITDFGFANTFDPRDELGEEIEYNLTNRDFVKKMDLERVRNGSRRGDLMQTSCGSPCYAAPELVVTDSLYTGRKVDVWSCGVILYAMLAGYLPFDDDPANPEGDNINLLYKYIVSTPLTFPEYVTPHARDLLRRILVPDPRKRADLFEVARHSWLSEYAHVVSHVTSSTTTVGEIANSTVIEDHQDTPLLARSASVREPTKPYPTNMSPVGGLSHQGKIDPEQTEQTKPPRDHKRRTVQVEYVAPQSQTARGEPSPTLSSTGVSPPTTTTGQQKTRAKEVSQGHTEVTRQVIAAASVSKPLPQEPNIIHDSRQGQPYPEPLAPNKAQPRSVGPQQGMPPPSRPARDVPRSVSDSTGAFGQIAPSSSARPNTASSMASTGMGRLPSRGNSYSQPLAPTVAATNAQGRLAQPKNGKQYNISAPIPHPEPYIPEPSIGRPSTQRVASSSSQAPPTPGQRDQAKTHKRSNTLGTVFGRSGSIFGRSQTQSPQEQPKQTPEKRYPPTSMKAPISSDSPRQSTDSRRPSFTFGRNSSDLSKREKSRRFSLLPASFSLKSFGGNNKNQSSDGSRPVSERKQSIGVQQAPPSRQQGMAFGRGASRSNSLSTEESVPIYDGQRDRNRQVAAPQIRRNELPAQSAQQALYDSTQYAPPQQFDVPSKPLQPGHSYLLSESGPPTESEVSISSPQQPRYPPGFNSYDDQQRRPSMQQARNRGPGVLQKNNRKFADAYEQEQDPGHHAGSSGAAKRVMDFFRRRGKARAGDDR